MQSSRSTATEYNDEEKKSASKCKCRNTTHSIHSDQASETEETKHLTTSELQRFVLLEQLKLIHMEQAELTKQKT